ncbi:MAG: adenylate kinase [Chloroflexi bacterium]|nr:adenylate kinase [Chloroflexota bacterium]
MYVMLLGAPGAGKGTQAHVLAEKLDLAHVASGDLFRDNLKQGTELGLLAKSYMDRGVLVPDEVTIAMVKERLAKPDCQQGAILDGFPRTIEQARALDDALKEMDKKIDKVLSIDVSEQELIRRLSGRWICRNCQASFHESSRPPKKAGACDECGGELYQRADDTVETARKRLDVYNEQTAPLIDYYGQAGVLVDINGEQDIELVLSDLLSVLQR